CCGVSGGRGVGSFALKFSVWNALPSFHVQVTVPPVCTTEFCGLNAKVCSVTAAEVGGAVATSARLAARGRPLTVARTRRIVPDASEPFVLAIPSAHARLC